MLLYGFKSFLSLSGLITYAKDKWHFSPVHNYNVEESYFPFFLFYLFSPVDLMVFRFIKLVNIFTVQTDMMDHFLLSLIDLNIFFFV